LKKNPGRKERRARSHNRKSGDLNRKSTHQLRSADGMAKKAGINPYAKMLGLSKAK
jgi:hypothetical protein